MKYTLIDRLRCALYGALALGLTSLSLSATPFAWSGKGIHEYDYNGVADNIASDLQAHHAVLNVLVDDLFPASINGPLGNFGFEGNNYQYSANALSTLKSQAELLGNRGITVTLVITLGHSAIPDFYYPGTLVENDGGLRYAFNMTNGSSGPRYFRAMIDLLSSQLTASNYVVGNEVQNPWAWNRCTATTDQPPLSWYASEYANVLRNANEVIKNRNANGRVYASFDPAFGFGRAYKGQDIIKQLQQLDSDFDWGIAWHPYTNSLNADGDTNVTLNYSTNFITMKNIEVLAYFVNQPFMRFNGQPRSIILSEQTFSDTDQNRQAAGCAFFYYRASATTGIDVLHWLRYFDDPGFAAYNLEHCGLVDYNGAAKKSYYVYKSIDTPSWKNVCDGYSVQNYLGTSTGVPLTSWTDLNPLVARKIPIATSVINCSHRAWVRPGEASKAGFIISDYSKRVLLRGVGAKLGEFGVPNCLPNALLRVFSNGNLIATNYDWQSGPNPAEVAQISSYVGAFPISATDAALVLTLPAGSYTAEVDSQDGNSGVTLAEVYDVDNRDGTGAGFANISGNSLVTDTEPGILSVIVSGAGTKGLLLRAVGPGLQKFGVSGFAPDPTLKWVNAVTGHLFYENDDWATNGLNKYDTDEHSGGLFSLEPQDAALFSRVTQGAYSLQVSSKGQGGRILAEIYLQD